MREHPRAVRVVESRERACQDVRSGGFSTHSPSLVPRRPLQLFMPVNWRRKDFIESGIVEVTWGVGNEHWGSHRALSVHYA